MKITTLFAYTLAFAIVFPVFSQKRSIYVTPSHNEAAFIDSIKKAGIPEDELPGLILYKRSKEYYSKLKTDSPEIQNTSGKSTLSASPCDNMGFEDATFNTWSADTGVINTITALATYSSGFSNKGLNASVFNFGARHTIFTTKPVFTTVPVPFPYTGYDEMIDFVDVAMPIDSTIPYIAPDGGNISIRLGNSMPNSFTEKLKKTFVVDAQSEAFVYSYAVVLEKAALGHDSLERPRFTVRLLDQNGTQLPGNCSFYEVYYGKDNTFLGFTDKDKVCYINSVGANTCRFRDFSFKNWTTVGVDLSPYKGQQITIEFTTRDCSLGGHFGYAYIDAKCTTFDIKSSFCPGEKKVKLTAPAGYVSYLWKDPAGNVIGNQQSVEINSPKLGDVYTVQIVSVTGCQSLLKSIIERAPPPIMPSYEITQNIITPNGDGKNDLFKTNQFDYIGSFNIEIYNRWGLKVFESSDPTKEWDGKNNGKDVDDGIYYWIAKYQSTCFEDPKDVLSKGFVHVLR